MLKLSGFWRNRTEEVAAIDLGSNSFHMVVAKIHKGELIIVDRLKENVRLANGLNTHGQLDEASQTRALQCLHRFNQRIKTLPSRSVRAIGTRTLRTAQNSTQFLVEAEAVLGFDIQIVSGEEEARLVYQGVASKLENDSHPRMVIDIGGGSSEIIIGQGFQTSQLESLGLGCVSLTKKFFNDEQITPIGLAKAHVYCRQKLEPFQQGLHQQKWQSSLGSSGTIKSIASVLGALNSSGIIQRDSLDELVKTCSQRKHFSELDFAKLSSQRRPVFLAGLIILQNIMHCLDITEIEPSPWALREGVLFDILGSGDENDIRKKSVHQLSNKFHVDQDHSQNLTTLAQFIFNKVSVPTTIDTEDIEGTSSITEVESAWSTYLLWACPLLEIGLDISHQKYHLHSSYIITHYHLAGFGSVEQARLAFLVNNHRKSINIGFFESLPLDSQQPFQHILFSLRLAVVLSRSRQAINTDELAVKFKKSHYYFSAPKQWWQDHSLTKADLFVEQGYRRKLPAPLTLLSNGKELKQND